MKIKVIIGPTASGKSEYALKYKNAEIINSDSIQLFRDLKILTARPNIKEQYIKDNHHLYGILNYNKEPNVMFWQKKVIECIKKLSQKNLKTDNYQQKEIIIVGGTGFYIKSLIHGLSPIPDIPINIKNEIRSLSFEALKEKANLMNPDILKKLKDKQRIQRALMVEIATNKSIFDWHKEKPKKLPYDFDIHLILPERQVLYKRIGNRFDQMIKNGAIDEVEKLLLKHPDVAKYPISKAIGFLEITRYINNEISKNDAINLAKTKTCQYAKRQITWFKNQIKNPKIINTDYSAIPATFFKVNKNKVLDLN